MTNPDPRHLAEVEREWPSLLADEHFVMRGDTVELGRAQFDEMVADIEAARKMAAMTERHCKIIENAAQYHERNAQYWRAAAWMPVPIMATMALVIVWLIWRSW